MSNYYLAEQPNCMDLHPSGWIIALGFKTGYLYLYNCRFRLYQLVASELKLCFEKLGKLVLAVSYNNGGNIIAIGIFYFL